MTSIPVWIAWLKYLSFVYYGTPTRHCAISSVKFTCTSAPYCCQLSAGRDGFPSCTVIALRSFQPCKLGCRVFGADICSVCCRV